VAHFAPKWVAHFAPKWVAHFAPKWVAHFAPKWVAHFAPKFALANASGVTPRTRDFHSPGIPSFEGTLIFVIRGTHSTYKKLAVQWLNEAFCFVSTFMLTESLVLRNRQLLATANQYKNAVYKSNIFNY